MMTLEPLIQGTHYFCIAPLTSLGRQPWLKIVKVLTLTHILEAVTLLSNDVKSLPLSMLQLQTSFTEEFTFHFAI